jgi:predicted amidophosphoribosyltransferase
MLEMYKRDRFNHELVTERCDELIGLEGRLQEVDAMLTQAAVARRAPPGSSRCVCGAPVGFGAHFCPNCGRPAGEAPVVTCAQCGSPLPAEALFCARCGTPTADDDPAAYVAPRPVPAPASEPPEPEPQPESEADPRPEAQPQG